MAAASPLDMTGRSRMSATGSPRVGVKRHVDRLEQEVERHAETLTRHERAIAQTGADAAELIRGLEESLRREIRELRTEVNQKLTVLSTEIGQLQKQLNIQKGEGNILSQQNKDTNRRVIELAESLSELRAEVLGDDD